MWPYGRATAHESGRVASHFVQLTHTLSLDSHFAKARACQVFVASRAAATNSPFAPLTFGSRSCMAHFVARSDAIA